MAKKFLALLLVFTFMTILAACESSNNANSDSSSSEVSLANSEEANSEEANSAAASNDSSEEASSDASETAEARIYYADGFSFAIPDGFKVTTDAKGNDMFVDSNFYMLGYEIEENEDGKTTITKEDFEKELAEEPENSKASGMTGELQSFKNIKVDGREAAIVFCNFDYQGMNIPTHAAEIIDGDKIIIFTLVANEEDSAILETLLDSVKFD